MTDAEYAEEVAVEVDALTRERDAISDRIDAWLAEAWSRGFSRTDIARVIDRQQAAAREAALALKPGQSDLPL